LRFRNDIFPHRYALRARIVVLGYFMRGSVVLVIVTDKRSRSATNDGMHPVAVWPSPSLPMNTEVLRDPHPMGEGAEEGRRRPKTQDTIGDLAVSVRRGRETVAEQGTLPPLFV
jgi:hypothetical protein